MQTDTDLKLQGERRPSPPADHRSPIPAKSTSPSHKSSHADFVSVVRDGGRGSKEEEEKDDDDGGEDVGEDDDVVIAQSSSGEWDWCPVSPPGLAILLLGDDRESATVRGGGERASV